MQIVLLVLQALAWGAMIVFIIHAIDYAIISKKLRVGKVKDLETKISSLELQVEICKKLLKRTPLSIEYAKTRDFFIRTNFIGKLTNKQLIEEFKTKIGDFEEFKTKVINYELTNLHECYKIYKHYHHKQIVLDSYKEKSKEAK